MAEPRVDFLIAGTQKGGTSALARFLGQHPSICMSEPKECHVFDDPAWAVAGAGADAGAGAAIERYASCFAHRTGETIAGEATPIYMYLPEIPRRVADYNPAMKWIVLLRDPVERALSQYAMEAGRGTESRSPLEAMRTERQRLQAAGDDRGEESSWRRHSYADRGRYRGQLQEIQRVVGREQLLILRSERLWSRHAETLARVWDFLGVDEPAQPPTRERVFPTVVPEGVSAEALAEARAYLEAELADERRWLEIAYPSG